MLTLSSLKMEFIILLINLNRLESQIELVMSVVIVLVTCLMNVPANKVSDDISMADDHLIAVLGLFWFCTMEILPERCFYTSTIFIELLELVMVL